MKKLFLLMSTVLIMGCAFNYMTKKPITGQIPSTDKMKLEGSKVSKVAREVATDEKKTYPVYQRLYDTVWFQTEEDEDDGEIEIETEFVFFNDDALCFEVEVENGKAEYPDEDDYTELKPVKEITHTSSNRTDGNDMNAWVMSKKSIFEDDEDDLEYEAYWLYKDDILYITEEDSAEKAEEEMIKIMNNLSEGDEDEKFLLSTVSPKL